MFIIIDLLYGPIIFCTKYCVLLPYYRLFGRHQWMRRLVYLGIGCILATYAAQESLYGYLCLPRPRQSWLEAALSSRVHESFVVVGYFGGSFSLASDLYLLFLPLPAVWQLHLPLRKKLGVAGIFMTGSL